MTLQVAAEITYKLRVSNYGVPGDIVLNWNLETAPAERPVFERANDFRGAWKYDGQQRRSHRGAR